MKLFRRQSSGTVVLSANSCWYIYNFRLPLIVALQQQGRHVAVVAPRDDYTDRLLAAGCRVMPIKIRSKSVNPFYELRTVRRYWRRYAMLKPGVIIHFTPKPNIYGTFIAHLLGIPCINDIAGLGNAFVRKSVLSVVVRLLYRITQSRVHTVFFQNQDDYRFFLHHRIVRREQAVLLPGSGVQLQHFVPRPLQRSVPDSSGANSAAKTDAVRFIMIARLIAEKGVGLYAEAARELRTRYPQVEFDLVGYIDTNNPGAYSQQEVESWQKEGVLRWVGRQEDVRPFIAAADCVVLPSYYREGTPRTLLEGAAMAKPLIAADSIGCREPVTHGYNGFLCQPRDRNSLIAAMERIVTMSPSDRQVMGQRSRAIAETRYNMDIVLAAYLKAVSSVG